MNNDPINESIDVTLDTEKRMLTTIDNPFNPFTNYSAWYAFDTQHGYNTTQYLARIAKVSDELSEAEEAAAINTAIAEIVRLDILGIYVSVTHDTFKDRSADVKLV